MADKKGFQSIDEYILLYPEETQKILNKLRSIIMEAAPEAEERMSWQMPTFYFKENLVHFAVHKNHIGFYPSPDAIIHFADRLADYKTTKGGIQFPFSKEMPYELVSQITSFRINEVKKKRGIVVKEKNGTDR